MRGKLVIGEWIVARQLFEICAVNQNFLDVPIFRRSVPLIGAALEHRRQQSAGGVPELGRHTGREELHFLKASIVVDVTWFVEPIIERTGSLPPTPSIV